MKMFLPFGNFVSKKHKDDAYLIPTTDASDLNNFERNQKSKYLIFAAGIAFLLFFISISAFFAYYFVGAKSVLPIQQLTNQRDNIYNCDIQLVESIPLGMNYSEGSPLFLSTFDAWKFLINNTKDTLDIGSFYWTMRAADVVNDSSAYQGEEIFNQFLSSNKSYKLRIVQSEPTSSAPNIDTELLRNYGLADVVSVNFQKYFGSGVLHTKLWIADNKHFYLGSANMDWRALTQVKEMGILAKNCDDLAQDVGKIFAEYWYLGSNPNTGIPQWSFKYRTNFNENSPMKVKFNQQYTMNTFFSSSPPPLSADGRTHDLDAILHTINSAIYFINIAVMDYIPMIVYEQQTHYWPFIDDALRKAAIERKVSIKLLISWWKHSRPSEDYFLRSLQALSNSLSGVQIEIRRFIVPTGTYANIPFARVNHNKYMVTDSVAYIGTSNWSGDYFTDTAGIGLVMKDTAESKNAHTIRTDLLSVFERDWNSIYAKKLLNDTTQH